MPRFAARKIELPLRRKRAKSKGSRCSKLADARDKGTWRQINLLGGKPHGVASRTGSAETCNPRPDSLLPVAESNLVRKFVHPASRRFLLDPKSI